MLTVRLSTLPIVRPLLALISVCGLVLMGGLVAPGAFVEQNALADGPKLTGMYGVVETTDLGRDVCVTLHIRLQNNSKDKVYITSLRRALAPAGPNQEETTSVIIEAHGRADFTQQFTVARNEYQHWGKGAPPLLFLRMQVAGGADTALTIQLIRQPQMSAK